MFVSTTLTVHAGKHEIVGKDYDIDRREVIEFTADAAEVDKVIKWQPGDNDLRSLKELVKIAKTMTKPPNGGIKYEPEPILIGVQWFQTERIGWKATLRLLFSPDHRVNNVKDGGVYIDIELLPNGAPIKRTTRPMTREELLEFGLVEPTAKEAEEQRKKFGSDPFAPTDQPKK